MKLLNEKHNGNFKTIVTDDKDGLHSLPFANHGSKIVMYYPNGILQKKISYSDKEKQEIIENAIMLLKINSNTVTDFEKIIYFF